MDELIRNMIKQLDDGADFAGWTGLNVPSSLECASGLWLTKAGTRYYAAKGWEYDPHNQPTHYEWGAVLEGELVLDCNGSSTVLHEGMYYFMPGGVHVKAQAKKPALLSWFEFTGFLCDEVLTLLGGVATEITTGSYTYEQVKTVLRMSFMMQYRPQGFNITGQSLLWRFISDTVGNTFYQFQSYSPEIKQAIYYIKNIPMKKKVKIAQLAEHVALSVETFRKRFQAEVGESPIQYLLHYHISSAKVLMGEKNISIKQIAYETGFSDPYYFSRLFKQYEGVSPLAFRKEMYPEWFTDL